MTNDVESPDYRYAQWAGNNAGQAQDATRCVEAVNVSGLWFKFQCSRKRKHGLYCTQHAKGK